MIKDFEHSIRRQFRWETWNINKEIEIKKKRIMCINKLMNIQICDICYMDEYIYLFKKYYYKMFRQYYSNNLVYNDIFLSKLSNLWI